MFKLLSNSVIVNETVPPVDVQLHTLHVTSRKKRPCPNANISKCLGKGLQREATLLLAATPKLDTTSSPGSPRSTPLTILLPSPSLATPLTNRRADLQKKSRRFAHTHNDKLIITEKINVSGDNAHPIIRVGKEEFPGEVN